MAVCYALQGCVVASAVDLAANAVVQTGKIAVKRHKRGGAGSDSQWQ